MKKISILVPTFNRGWLLDDFFDQLYKVLYELDCLDSVSLIVSDNGSSDHTKSICERWKEVYEKNTCNFRYYLQDKNIGVAENLLFLFSSVATDYFLFLGDDDYLEPEAFGLVLKIIDSKPSAIIQTKWSRKPLRGVPASGWVSGTQAMNYFYEFGNAWAGIYRTAAVNGSINTLKERNRWSFVQKSWWPQTIIGFVSMLNNGDSKSVYLIDRKVGGNRIKAKVEDGQYWHDSMTHLLEAGNVIDKLFPERPFRSTFCISQRRWFFNRIKLIAGTVLRQGESVAVKRGSYALLQTKTTYGALMAVLLVLASRAKIMSGVWYFKKVKSYGFRFRRANTGLKKIRSEFEKKKRIGREKGLRTEAYFDED